MVMAQSKLAKKIKDRIDQGSIPTRIPPQSVEAEVGVLGSLLIDKNAIVKIAEALTTEHFYQDRHAEIFKAILSLYEKRLPSDLVTLTEELKKTGKFEEVGGASYLTTLDRKNVV